MISKKERGDYDFPCEICIDPCKEIYEKYLLYSKSVELKILRSKKVEIPQFSVSSCVNHS